MIKEKRPWGLFKQFALNKKCTAKILEVKPNKQLSYQKHKKREEYWYFLTEGFAFIDGKKKKIKEGGELRIKKNQPHRLIAGKNKLSVLEISFGKFSEKDETRIEDDYGRK